MMSVSGKLTPQAFTLMTTSPLPGLSGSTSSSTRLSGKPYSLHRTAFIESSPRRDCLASGLRVGSDKIQDASPGICRFVGILLLAAVEEAVRRSRIGDDFMLDVGPGECIVELFDLV